METPLRIRPSQLMCLVCLQGTRRAGRCASGPLENALRTLQRDPRAPVTLCTFEDYRPPAFGHDGAPGSRAFNIVRDAEILKRAGLHSGETLPLARALLSITQAVKTPGAICAHEGRVSATWRGCPPARRGRYERGREKVERLIASLLPGKFRSEEERDRAKNLSAPATRDASALRLFPNHLCCITCHYGNGLDAVAPNVLHHDNLYEVAEAMRRNPRIPVTLVSSGCMVCPPCHALDAETGLCGIVFDNDLRKAGYNLLRRIDLDIGDTMPAGLLMRRLYDRVLTTIGGCGDTRCNQPHAYDRGRMAGLGFLDAWENTRGVIARVNELLGSRGVGDLLPPDESSYMLETVRRAAAALKKDRREEAYRILIERRFWIIWKSYLEKAAVSHARLPSHARLRAAEDGKKDMVSLQTRGPVQCDGRLDEADWKRAPTVAGFETAESRPAVAEIGVKSLHDRDNLYFALLCAEQDTRRLKADARTGSEIMGKLTPAYETEMALGMGAYPWHESDDVLSIVIQPDARHRTYFQFFVNPRGIGLAQRFFFRDKDRQAEACHGMAWSAAVTLTRKLWTAEIAIPWRSIGMKPERAARGRINFHRVFGRELLAPRIRLARRKAGPGFDYVGKTRPINPLCRVPRAPESWRYSPGRPWHDQWHDLARMGRLELA